MWASLIPIKVNKQMDSFFKDNPQYKIGESLDERRERS